MVTLTYERNSNGSGIVSNANGFSIQQFDGGFGGFRGIDRFSDANGTQYDVGLLFHGTPVDNDGNSIDAFLAGLKVNDTVTFEFPNGTITGIIGVVDSATRFTLLSITSDDSGAIADGAIVTLTDGVPDAPVDPMEPVDSDPVQPATSITLKVGQAYRCYRWPGTANVKPANAVKGIFHVTRRDVQPYQPINASLELYGGQYVFQGSTDSVSSGLIVGICQGLYWDIDFGELRFEVDGELYRVLNAKERQPLRFELTMQRLGT